MPKIVDLTGQSFGRLTVIERDLGRHGKVYWKCKCTCGNMVSVAGTHLLDDSTKSCGCLRSEASAKCFARNGARDVRGYKFDLLTPDHIEKKASNGAYLWYCKCDCGGHILVTSSDLWLGRVKSCGCLRGNQDLTNQIFGKLLVKELAYVKDGQRYWKCECSCAEHTTVYTTTNKLKFKQVQSCGCLRREVSSQIHMTHGDSRTRLYRIWANMWNRCNNPTADVHDTYWNANIIVDPAWEDYSVFQQWAKCAGYREGLSLDRQNPFKGYSPENCRWIPLGLQEQNKKETYLIVAQNCLMQAIKSVPVVMEPYVIPYLKNSYQSEFWCSFFKSHNWDALDEESYAEMEFHIECFMQAAMNIAVIYFANQLILVCEDSYLRDLLDETVSQAYGELIGLQKEYDKYGWPLPKLMFDNVSV